ncbi:MAG: hypothetical protein MUE73_19915 [Planctomycetes bacterium]|nr:hypothetical protein [Planctomycetota bacterium]
MKTTIDIPDEIYRRVKARSALEGRAVRDVVIDLFRRWLGQRRPDSAGPSAEEWVEDWIRLGRAGLAGKAARPTATEILIKDRRRRDRS